MRVLAIICNLILFVITGSILLDEGLPKVALYLVFTFLMLLVPLFSAVVLVLNRITSQGPNTNGKAVPIRLTNLLAAFANLVLAGASCWAIVVQYPYPEGNSMILFALLAICTPILSIVALLGVGRSALREKLPSAADSDVRHSI